MSEYSVAKPITTSLSEAIALAMTEGKHDFSTGDLKKSESLDEAKTPWQTYQDNEEVNDHSGNVVHMAKHVGTPADVKTAAEIKSNHMRDGHLTTLNGLNRNALSDKLWPKFRKQFAPKDVKESYNSYKYGNDYDAGGAGGEDPTEDDLKAELKRQAKKNTLASKRDKLDRKAEKSLAPRETPQ